MATFLFGRQLSAEYPQTSVMGTTADPRLVAAMDLGNGPAIRCPAWHGRSSTVLRVLVAPGRRCVGRTRC